MLDDQKQSFVTRIISYYGVTTNFIENYMLAVKNMFQFCYLSIADVKRIMLHFNIPYIFNKEEEFYQKIEATSIYLTNEQHGKFMEFARNRVNNINITPIELNTYLYENLSLNQLFYIDTLITAYQDNPKRSHLLQPYTMELIKLSGGSAFNTCDMVRLIPFEFKFHMDQFNDYCSMYKYNYPIFAIFKLMNIAGSIKMPLYTGVYPSTGQMIQWMWYILSDDFNETIFDSFISSCDEKQLTYIGL